MFQLETQASLLKYQTYLQVKVFFNKYACSSIMVLILGKKRRVASLLLLVRADTACRLFVIITEV